MLSITQSRFLLINRSRGYSLLELAIVLSVLTLLTIQLIPLQDEYNETIAEQYTSSGFQDLAHAAKTFYVQSGGVSWPADLDTLINAGLLPGYSVGSPKRFNNGFGNEYALSVVGDAIEISSVVASPVNAQSIATAWGPLASYDVATSTVTVAVLRPGHEVSHDALLPRDGSRPMIGDLDMQANNLINGAFIYSDEVVTDRVDATNTSETGLVESDTVDAKLISAEDFEYKSP